MADNIATWISLGIFAIVYLLVAIRFVRNRLAPIKKVRATVIDKSKTELLSTHGRGKRYRYAIVFSANGRKLSFYVSAFSYDGYRKGESGMLTYQGSRLIDFH